MVEQFRYLKVSSEISEAINRDPAFKCQQHGYGLLSLLYQGFLQLSATALRRHFLEFPENIADRRPSFFPHQFVLNSLSLQLLQSLKPYSQDPISIDPIKSHSRHQLKVCQDGWTRTAVSERELHRLVHGLRYAGFGSKDSHRWNISTHGSVMAFPTLL
jgi:hypothetical protein